jgi:F1F0 ATPase subunit 2
LSDIELLCTSLAAGMLLGMIFFGGLWWTVQRGVSARRPVLWFSGSLLLRISISMAGFYALSASGWQAPLLGVLGFIIARAAVTRLSARVNASSHAP